MKTWNDYKEYVKKTDSVAKADIEEAERIGTIADEIKLGVQQAIRYEKGDLAAKTTVLSSLSEGTAIPKESNPTG